MQQQGEAPASLAIGTQVSAKYKGAFCEAKVRSVLKQVKCRVTFKQQGLGSTTLSDEYVRSDSPLYVGASVTARHPDKQEYLDATVNKIQDQSQYTVVFDDGDITTLRRNALCMKSGKHYNASESLDNLPLTHPEHFSTPVGGRRRRGPNAGGGESDADYDSSSDNEDPAISSTYLANVGRVVCIENADKKSKQPKESWFPALIVAPAASGTVKIDTKEEFLVRSFKDGRYYTVTKKDTTRFHRDAIKKVENAHLKDAMEKAVSYIEKGELPPHWDKETLFKMGDDSTTESSESESLDDEEDDESPEEKDHLVAELYKHMEDRGAPINKTPSIGNKDVDLYKLFRIVYKMGGHSRVTNSNSWRQVALKLGFETTWCINQVRVHYKRYLQSFEELYRTLGCTMKNHPRSRRQSGSSSSNRAVIRGKHRSGGGGSKTDSSSVDVESDKSSISSQDDKIDNTPSPAAPILAAAEKGKSAEEQMADERETVEVSEAKNVAAAATTKRLKSDRSASKEKLTPGRPLPGKKDEPTEKPIESTPGKKGRPQAVTTTPAAGISASLAEIKEEAKMTTRPRRDSTSSLAAAMQVKAHINNIGDDSRRPVVRVDRDKETENEVRKLQTKNTKSSVKDEKTAGKPAKEDKTVKPLKEEQKPPPSTPPIKSVVKEEKVVKSSSSSSKEDRSFREQESATESNDGNDTNDGEKSKKRFMKRKTDKESSDEVKGDEEDKQQLPLNVEVLLGDKIKVFYKLNNIYEAKVIKTEEKPNEKYPRYLVHYQGWNARYDEWIKRCRIAENLSWNKDKERQNRAAASATALDEAAVAAAAIAEQSSKKDTTKPARREEKKEPQSPIPATDKSATRSKAKLLLTPKSADVAAAAAAPATVKPDTPTSSRTNSRTGSPAALKRQSSRTSTKKESESEEEEEEEVRKSARLHRPSGVSSSSADGRRSIRSKRPHGKEESETEEVDIEKDGSSDSSPAKPKRGRKGTTTPSKPPFQGAGAAATEDSSSEDKSGETNNLPRPRRSTPSREKATTRQGAAITHKSKEERRKGKQQRSEDDEEEDPYAFKEPEPFDEVKFEAPRGGKSQQTPKKAASNSSNSSKEAEDSEGEKSAVPEVARVKRESDSTDSGSDENGKRTSRTRTKGGKPPSDDDVSPASDSKQDSSSAAEEEEEEPAEAKAEVKVDTRVVTKELLEQGKEVETCKPLPEQQTVVKVEGKAAVEQKAAAGGDNEAKSDEVSSKRMETASATAALGGGSEGKSLLQMTKKQRELFPFLSAIRTTTVADMSNRRPATGSTRSAIGDSSAANTASETTAAAAPGPMIESPARSVKVKSRSQSPNATTETKSSYSRQKTSAAKKRKTPRKPNSSEIVESESESDGGGHHSTLEEEINKAEVVTASKKPSRGGKKAAAAAAVVESSSSDSPSGGGKKRDEPAAVAQEESHPPSTPVAPTSSRPDKKRTKKEDPPDDLDLACAETIPGSPVHSSSATEVPTPPKLAKTTANRLEMPFASVPESIHGPAPAAASAPGVAVANTAALPASLQPPRKNYSEDDEETPDTMTSASQSPREARKDGSKSPAESSEVDMDSLSGRKAAGSEDSRLDVEADSSRRSWKRKMPSSPAAQAIIKRKRKPREASLRGGSGRGGRGSRHGSGRFGGNNSRGGGGHDEETDEGGEDHKDPTIASIGSLDNEALAALSRRSPKSSKYNFFVDLDTTMDSATKISRIQKNLEELRKTYATLKGELAVIERRRKKIRKKERERSEKDSGSGGGNHPVEATA